MKRKIRRKVIRIDEEKCNGCGICVDACIEGAIQLIDGKAKLVSEIYCDGLGACIGECPEGAITIEEREAEEFDSDAVKRHLQQIGKKTDEIHSHSIPMSCPGSAVRSIGRGGKEVHSNETNVNSTTPEIISRLSNWPVQIYLVPPNAPYFQEAKLLIAADCTPFAYADFHRRFIKDRIVLIGCPKLDDTDLYFNKLTDIFRYNKIKEIEIAYMEVPCCYGLVHLIRRAIQESGKEIPLVVTMIGIGGEILQEEKISSKNEKVASSRL